MALARSAGMPKPRKKGHQDESGKPTNTRGKPPHRGGHKAGSKRNVTFKIGGKPDGSGGVSSDSPWKPGKCRPSSAYKSRKRPAAIIEG